MDESRGDSGQLLRTSAGSYEIYGHVASGAFGTVHFCRDLATNRAVAVKRLHAHLAYEPDVVERFQQEAARLRGLSHPNIVQVLDQGMDERSVPFIVLEWVDGWTILQLLRQQTRLSIGQAVEIASQTLQALEVTAARGIVHRDIKPANLMVTPPPDQRVKVMDFGIAKDVLAEVTGAHTRIGTPAYMAPEQLRGARVDMRSDVYALGITFYELLAGQKPFDDVDGDTPQPLLELRPEVGSILAGIVHRAFATRPAERFQSPGEMRAALAPFITAGSGLATQPGTDSAAEQTGRRVQQHVPPTMPAQSPVPPPTVPAAPVPVERPAVPVRIAERRPAMPTAAVVGAGLIVAVVLLITVFATRTGTPDLPTATATLLPAPGLALALATEPPQPTVAASRTTVAVAVNPTTVATPAILVTPTAAATVPVAATPTTAESWAAEEDNIAGQWQSNLAEAIASIRAFLDRHPDYGPAKDKLYAAYVNYGTQLITNGDVEAGIAELDAAQGVDPLRSEAPAALAALTPTATPEPTSTPVAIAPAPRVVATPVRSQPIQPPRPTAVPAPPAIPAPPAQQDAPPTKGPFRS